MPSTHDHSVGAQPVREQRSSFPDAGHAPGNGWGVAVERGPEWLFLRIEVPETRAGAGDRSPLAERLWGMIREHRAHRVVLELDRVCSMDDSLIGAIADVGTRVRDDGGLFRVCGLSEPNLSRLQSVVCEAQLPHFDSRSAAVVGGDRAIP